MLRLMAVSVPARPAYTKGNEKKLDIDGDGSIDCSRINDKMTHL